MSSLEKHLTKSGAWLFRWRSYLPLLLIAVLIPAFGNFSYPLGLHSYDLVYEIICFLISLFGLFIRCYTVSRTPQGTSGRNTKRQKADILNTTGIYSVTRNPLYLGNFFMLLGVSMFVGVWWFLIIYVLSFCLYYERIIMAEESFLKNKFGKEYEDYLNRTPVFIPNFRLWKLPLLPVSLQNILKREYSGFFAIISAFTILELAGDYIVKGEIVLNSVWTIIFIFGFLVYITLRTLKKKTRLLHVKGR